MTVEQIPLQRAKFRISPVMEHVILPMVFLFPILLSSYLDCCEKCQKINKKILKK